MTLKELGLSIDDTTPLDVAITKISSLRDVLVELGTTSDKNAKSYAVSLGQINKGAQDLDKVLGGLDATLKDNQSQIAANTAQASKLLEAHNLNKKGFDEESKAAAQFSSQAKTLQKAQEDLTKASVKGGTSIGDLKKQLIDASKAAKNTGTATDAIVTTDAIKKVQDLSKTVTTASNAIASSNKVVAAASGFYEKLKGGVESAKNKLKDLAGGIGSNTEQFKSLKKSTEEGADKIKKFEENLGKAGKESDHTGAALEKLDEASGGAVGKTKELAEGFKLLIASPVGAFFLLLALALESVNEFFRGSIEGEDEFNKTLLQGQAILETVKSFLEGFGKVLYETFSKPGEAIDQLLVILEPAKKALTDIWNDPIQAIEDLGNAIVENVINRFKSVGVAFEAVDLFLQGEFTQGFKKLGDAGIQAITGITDGTDKIIDVYNAVADAVSDATDAFDKELARRQALNAKYAALENKLKKDRIADIVDDAKTELAVFKLQTEASDKLRNSANERFDAQKKVGQVLEDQLKGDIKLANDEIALQQLLIQRTGSTYEANTKLAELQAKRIGLESAFEKALKKRQATETALLAEDEKERLAKNKRIADAERALGEVIIKGRIDANKDAIADDRTSFAERADLIIQNGEAQEEILKSQNAAQADAAHEAAIARADIDAEALDAILNNTKLKGTEINAAIRDLAEEAIKTDGAYADEIATLNEQLAQGIENVNQETINAVAENAFKELENSYHHLIDSIDQSAATEALGLNTALEQGNISFKEYQEARQLIQEEAQAKALKSQIDFLKQEIAIQQAAGRDVSQLSASLAQTELALSDAQNSKLIEGQQLLQDKLKELKTAGVANAVQTINNLFDAESADRAARLEALTLQYENETTLAGDNNAKKLEIENAFNLEKAKIDKEQKAADRKKAIFNRAVALVEIAINTAKGIGLALGTFPPPVSFALAAVTAVLGALQVAAVLSKPIPAFAEGTDSAPGGLSIVNDGTGPELVVGKQGARIYDTTGPALVNLDKGDRVYTAERTASILRDSDQMIAGFDDDTQKLKFLKAENDVDLMTRALGNKLDELIDATKRNKPRGQDNNGMASALARALALRDYEAREYR